MSGVMINIIFEARISSNALICVKVVCLMQGDDLVGK